MNYNNYQPNFLNGMQPTYASNYPTPNYNYQLAQQQNMAQNNSPRPAYNNFSGAYVNGIEDAKAYIIGANQTVYLRDNNSDLLFVKTADNQGRYSMKAYHLREDDTQGNEYVKQADFISLQDSVNKLSSMLQNYINGTNLAVKSQNNSKGVNKNAN